MTGDVIPFRGGQAAPSAPVEYHAPQSVETEAGLLGALLTDPDAFGIVAPILEEHHFFDPAHRHVYRAMTAVAHAGQTVTFSLVRASLGTDWLEAEIVAGWYRGREYLAHLATDISILSGLADTAKLIRDYWALRELSRISSRAATGEGYVAPTVLSHMLDEIDQVRASLMDRERKSSSAGQAAIRVLDRIERAHNGELPDYPVTGLTRVDDVIGGGLQGAKLVSAFGRTSMGKSVLGIEVTDRVAEQGFGAIYNSLEMPAEAVAARMLSSRLERDGHHITWSSMLRHGASTAAQAKLIRDMAARLQDLPFKIEDGGGKTIAEIAAVSERRANEMARKNIKLGLVVIDHAHIVKFGRKHNREDEGLREVTQGALALCKSLECTVLLLGQLNRNTENTAREDKRPQLVDIRGGGSFEEDSDTVLFLYRQAYYVQRSAEYRAGDPDAMAEFRRLEHVLEVIVDKNRQGPANEVRKLWIDVGLNAIRNLDDTRGGV